MSWYSTVKIFESCLCLHKIYLTYFCFSISAQSSYALGAVLNATCGTVVEMILSVVVLNKGNQSGSACYVELVKSNLAGKIIEIKKFLYLYLKWSRQCSYEEKLWLGGIFFANNWFALCDWKCYLSDGVMAPDADLFFYVLCLLPGTIIGSILLIPVSLLLLLIHAMLISQVFYTMVQTIFFLLMTNFCEWQTNIC